MTKKILLVANMPQRVSEQVLLCTELRRMEPNFDFLFLSVDDRQAHLFENENLECIAFGKKTKKAGINQEPSKWKSRVPKMIRMTWRAIERGFWFEIRRFIKVSRQLRIEKLWIQARIDEFNPDLVILNGDRHLGLEPAVLKICHERDIPTLVPYFVYSNEEGPLFSSRNNPALERSWRSPLLTHLAFFLFPSQVIRQHNRAYLFYQPAILFALKRFGSLSAYPWCIGNGSTAIVCVDNHQSEKRYTELGVPAKKLRLVGDIAYSRLYKSFNVKDQKRQAAVERYGLDEDKKIVICGLPHLGEHGMITWSAHWEDIDRISKALSDTGENVLVSLHPKMDRKDYKFLEDDHGLHILDERLYEMLPIADLFVAGFSSTVIWSALCGVPSIVLDTAKLGYDMFDFLSSVKIVKDRNTYLDELNSQLKIDRTDFSKDWELLARDQVFDENTMARYKELIGEMVESRG